MNTHSKHSLVGQKFGFFGKGGAGKSTVTVLVARALKQSGYTVCVVDADSTNIGLHRALGISHPPSPLIDYYGGMIFSGGSVPCPVDDPTPIAGAEISLDALPSDYYAQAEPNLYLLSAGKLGASGAGAGCDGPISKIARDIHIQLNAKEIVTLVDFKAGFEDTARGVITRMDWAITVLDPTQASLAFARHMKNTVQDLSEGHLPATAHLEGAQLVELANRLFQERLVKGALFILNKIHDEKTESFLMQHLSADEIEPIGTIYDDSRIGEAWLKGTPIDLDKTRSDIAAIVHQIENAVAKSERQPI